MLLQKLKQQLGKPLIFNAAVKSVTCVLIFINLKTKKIMSEITLKKQKVMEAILHSNAAIDAELIKWINSHLPNDTEKEGTNLPPGLEQLITMKFDHTQKDVVRAINPKLEPKDFIAALNKKIRKQAENKKMTEIIDVVIKDYSSEEIAFLLYLGIRISKD